MGTGVNVSKANVYAVTTPPAGVSVSKANVYAVTTPPAGVLVSKANVYAVINSFPGAWLIIQEPGTGYVDQTHRMDGRYGQSGSFTAMMRDRTTADIPLRVPAGDPYSPGQTGYAGTGTPVWLFDVDPSGTSTLVFSGVITKIEETWDGQAGYRIYHLTASSLEAIMDSVLVPPQAFFNQTCGAIISTVFTSLMSGSQLSLGSIGAGLTLPALVIEDWPTLWQFAQNLATQSQYVTGVDLRSQTFYFRAANTTPAPYSLVTSQMLWETAKWTQDDQDFRDGQIVRISKDAFAPSAEQFAGTGSAWNFTLRNPVSQVSAAWITKNTQNTATGTFSGLPSNGDTITIAYPGQGSIYNWAANSPYNVGQVIIDPANHVQKATQQGTSGGTQPTWNDNFGTTSDGPGSPNPPPYDHGVIWQDEGVSGGGNFGSSIYTLVTTLDNTQWGQVLIGASAASTAQNLVDAINGKDSTRGVKFSKPTWENPLVNADAPSGGTFTIRNKSAGSGYVAVLAESATNFAWSAGLTSGGSVVNFSTSVLQVAAQGSSNTANLYYTPGSASVYLASLPTGTGASLPLSSSWSLAVQYTRLGADSIFCENTSLVNSRATIEYGTGKYQRVINDTSRTSNAQGLVECQQALQAYQTIPITFQFETLTPGLIPGQWLSITFSDLPAGIAALVNGSYVVQEVRGELITTGGKALDAGVGAGHYRYTVSVINTSVIGSWLAFWQGLGSGGSGGSSQPVVLGASPAGGVVAGTVTSVALTVPTTILTVLSGSPITTSGTIAIGVVNQSANTVWAGPTSGGANSPAFRALVVADIPSLAYVTSVALALPSSVFTVSGSPISTSGTLTGTFATQTANTIFAGPTGGGASTPAFRSLVAADLPAGTLRASNNLSDVASVATSATNLGLGTSSSVTFNDLTLANSSFPPDGRGLFGNNVIASGTVEAGSFTASGTPGTSGTITPLFTSITVVGGIITAIV